MDSSQGYISLNQIINSVYKVFDTENVTVADMADYAAEALQFIGSFDTLEKKYAKIEICNHKGILPCGIEKIDEVREFDNKVTLEHTSDTFMYYNTKSEFKNDLLENVLFKYSIENGYITVPFKDGFVEMMYKGIPTDEKGFPLIPDNVKIKNAVRYHILYQIAQGLFYSGKISGDVYQDITQNRDWYIASSQSQDKILSPDKMATLAKQLTSLIQYENDNNNFNYPYNTNFNNR